MGSENGDSWSVEQGTRNAPEVTWSLPGLWQPRGCLRRSLCIVIVSSFNVEERMVDSETGVDTTYRKNEH